MDFQLGRGRITVSQTACNKLPYATSGEVRPVVSLNVGHVDNQLVTLAHLEAFQDALRAVQNADSFTLIGGSPHYYYDRVAIDALRGTYIMSQDEDTLPERAQRVVAAHKTVLDERSCVICDEPFTKATAGYRDVALFRGAIPTHAGCCPTMATKLNHIWEHSGELIGTLS